MRIGNEKGEHRFPNPTQQLLTSAARFARDGRGGGEQKASGPDSVFFTLTELPVLTDKASRVTLGSQQRV